MSLRCPECKNVSGNMFKTPSVCEWCGWKKGLKKEELTPPLPPPVPESVVEKPPEVSDRDYLVTLLKNQELIAQALYDLREELRNDSEEVVTSKKKGGKKK